MDKKLFNDREEEKSFYNLLADRKLKKINKNKESYDSDINEDLIKCEEILTRNNAKTNYVSDLLKLNKEDPKKPEISKQITELNKEFTKFLNTLTLTDREDLEFYSKRIANRLERIDDADLTAQNLKTFYPNLGNFEYEDRMQIFDKLFGEKNPYKVTPLKEANELEKKEIKEEPKLRKEIKEEPKPVKEIKEEILREEVIGIRSFKKEPKIEFKNEVIEKEPELDTKEHFSYKASDDDLINSFIEKDVVKESFITENFFELDNINEKPEEIKEEPVLEETNEPELDTLNPFDINLEEIYDEPKEEKVKFVMPEGTSLVDISIALCGYSSGWLDIFAANKDLFNKIILENNASYINIEYNNSLFAGLEINIPVVFKKDIDRNNLKTI